MNVDLLLKREMCYSINDSTTGCPFQMMSAETHQFRKVCKEELEHKMLKKYFMLKTKSATWHSRHLIPQCCSGKLWENSVLCGVWRIIHTDEPLYQNWIKATCYFSEWVTETHLWCLLDLSFQRNPSPLSSRRFPPPSFAGGECSSWETPSSAPPWGPPQHCHCCCCLGLLRSGQFWTMSNKERNVEKR